MNIPPLGPENLTQRVCSRVIGYKADTEMIICGREATEHIIYWWGEEPQGTYGECYDHGFACAEHWADYQRHWTYAGHHEINHACGMPGSRLHPETACWLEDLPVAEPVRTLAVVSAA
jgi:hypothetical protein